MKKFLKKPLIFTLTAVMLFAVLSSGCNSIAKYYDMSDPKITWAGNIDENFTDDRIIVILRKNSDKKVPSLSYYGLDNAKSIRYLFGPSDSAEEGTLHTDMAVIYLKEKGKDKVVEAIKIVEKKPIVKCVEPNYIYPID